MTTTTATLRHPHHFPGRPRAHVEVAPARQIAAGAWRYATQPRRRLSYTAGLLLSVGLHTAIFFGFNRDVAPVRAAAQVQEQVVQIEMPPLTPEEPEQKLEELTETAPAETVAVPQLVDVPTMVALNDFTQQIDLRPQTVDTNALRQMAIPVNHGRGGAGAGNFGNVFKLSDLDRIPTAVAQPAPQFPQNLPSHVTEGHVLVTFIVDADGVVRDPSVLSSSDRDFERSAVTGVMRWKFRPGMKGGRKVATRMEVPIKFEITD
ncbi:MAG: energy transducer TonB [Opitutus sp.]|nr:energy transducer TonB [Opitutus sp.]